MVQQNATNQITGAVASTTGSVVGQILIDSTTGHTYRWNGSVWISTTWLIGESKEFGIPTAQLPSGWAIQDGRALSKTGYPEYAALVAGTVYENDPLDSSRCLIPDRRGRTGIGTGQGGGLTSRALGDKGGAETHTLVLDETPSHAHAISRRTAAGSSSDATSQGSGTGVATINTGSAGGDGAHNNMQPWLSYNYAIYVGRTISNGVTSDAFSVSASYRGIYSLRKVRGAYTGNAIQIRRSSDNATLNIGFDGSGNLDTSEIISFVGSNSAYVTTLYDQSSNGFNLTQATAGNQPRIVNAGTVETKNGRPCLRFVTGSTTWIGGSCTLTGADAESYSVQFKTSSSPSSARIISSAGSAGQQDWDNTGRAAFVYSIGTSLTSAANGVQTSTSPTVTNDVLHTCRSTFTGTTGYVNVNGGTGTASTNITTNFAIGYLRLGADTSGSPTGCDGGLSELLLFDSVLSSTDRSTIQTNQKSYYGTP